MFFRKLKRVNCVFETFWHFSSFWVPDQSMNQYIFKGHIIIKIKSHHDHPCYPEKDNIESCYKKWCWIIFGHIIIIFRPSKSRKWPESGWKPSVQDIFILSKLYCFWKIVFCSYLFFCWGNINFTFIIIPSRNLMPPPNLSWYAPILNVVHPFKVSFLPVLRNKLHIVIFNFCYSSISKFFSLYKPLISNHWL